MVKIDDVKKLQPGDRVYWNDPDNGLCSGIKIIKTITVKDDRYVTIESEGGLFECFPNELSRPPVHMR